MAGPRQSGMLPTIKCSTCGNQVEISMMGEHVCSGVGPATDPMPSLEALDTFRPFNKAIHEKVGKVPPLDTNAANRLYMRQGSLTPMSNSTTGSRGVSPRTPGARPGAGRLDDHLAPEIASDETSSPRSRRPGGYGGFGDADGADADAALSASPQKQSPGFLTRNLTPGPFEVGKPGSSDGERPVFKNPFGGTERRPSTSHSNAGFAEGNMAPPRMPQKDGYGGFGPPERSQSHDDFVPKSFAASRSETFPELGSGNREPPARTPSAPGLRPSGGMRRPSEATITDRTRRPSAGMGPDTSRAPPPRTSIVRPRTAGKDGSNGPSINLAAEFGIGNPYHKPTESMSSVYSGSSGRGGPSSNTSPSSSVDSHRNASDTSSFDNLMSDLQSSMDELKPKELTSALDKPRSASNGSASRPDMRHDPATQPGSRLKLAPPDHHNHHHHHQPPLSPGFPPSPTAGGAARGYCKACSEPITTGKVISSADGRLTGRYHKACFVCTTCAEPFASSTFYVHGDRPYCDRHYHKLNGSLCGGCSLGIEGQYLADEREKKYHPGCFRCPDCGVVLRDGYFEVSGAAYCEQDAWRRIQAAAPPPMPPHQSGWPGSRGRLGPPGASRVFGGPKGPPSSRGGFPAGPGGMRGGQYGPPNGNRLAPGQPRPRMEKRMTRLGMM